MEETKKCDKCLEEKSIDNFYIKRGKPMNLCKPCKKARDKEYRETPENKEKIKQRNYYWNNNNKEYFKEYNSSEEVKLYKKEYKEKNRDRILEYEREYREKNKDEINQYQREYRAKNKEKYKEYYEKSKETYSKYKERNKDKIRERMNKYFRERKEIDPLFKLSCNIRTMIYNSLIKKGYSKETKSYDILGIDYDELKLHFESKFESWMTWDNHGLYNGDFNYGWDIDHIIPLASAETEDDIIRLNHYSNLQPLCSKVNRDIKKSTL